ncbi:MAG: hypothetical protein HY749_17030 [Gammaproteobacteria bacterium]|nr:hypothetical protein [Gammaproteobacteria bacterium]
MRHALLHAFSIAALVAALFLAWIWRDGGQGAPAVRYANPLYETLLSRPEARGLDLSYLRAVSEDRSGPGPLANPLFASEPHSYDVILFGDSTLAWGTLPSVIAEGSGLRVGLFAYESGFLNRRMTRLYDALARTYLEPGGLAVFSFAAWTQLADPDLVRLYGEDFVRIETAIAAGGLPGRLDRREAAAGLLSATGIAQWRHRLHERLFGAARDRDPVLLPLPAKPPETPARSDAGPLDVEAMHPRFLRAEPAAVTVMVDADAALRSVASDEAPPFRDLAAALPDTAGRGHLETNAAAFRALAAQAPYRSVFMIPIYAASDRSAYLVQRALYRFAYAEELCVLDLGTLHPRDETLPVGREGHVVNEGGLVKSVLIAKALADARYVCPGRQGSAR